MDTSDPSAPPLDIESPDGLDEHYQGIQDELRTASPDDLRLQLPNVVDSIRSLSVEEDTVRFLLGVSFTHDYTPLDYRLERYLNTGSGDSHRVETVKEPVSGSHGYLSVIYPPDPAFDWHALRSVLLAAVERNRHTLETDPTASVTGSRLVDLWDQL